MFIYQIDDEVSLTLIHCNHAKEIVGIVNRQKEYLGEYLPWVATCDENSYQEFAKFALHKYADDKGIDTNIIYQGQIVGAVSLNNIYTSLKKADIGYWLSQEYQGRGIMTRAVRGIMNIAKEYYGVQVLEIKANEDNIPSRKVAERLGFAFNGIIFNNENVNGKIVNHALYSYRFD